MISPKGNWLDFPEICRCGYVQKLGGPFHPLVNQLHFQTMPSAPHLGLPVPRPQDPPRFFVLEPNRKSLAKSWSMPPSNLKKKTEQRGGTWNQTENSENSTTIDYNVDHGPTRFVMLSKHEMFCVDPYSNECHMIARKFPKSPFWLGWSMGLGPHFVQQSLTISQLT